MKRWWPLAVGSLLIGAMVLVKVMRTREPARMPAPTGAIARSQPQRPVMPEVPPPQVVAGAAEEAQIRQEINRAIGAAVKRDEPMRQATMQGLKKRPHLASEVIGRMIQEGSNPEWIRQLDLLRKAVQAP